MDEFQSETSGSVTEHKWIKFKSIKIYVKLINISAEESGKKSKGAAHSSVKDGSRYQHRLQGWNSLDLC